MKVSTLSHLSYEILDKHLRLNMTHNVTHNELGSNPDFESIIGCVVRCSSVRMLERSKTTCGDDVWRKNDEVLFSNFRLLFQNCNNSSKPQCTNDYSIRSIQVPEVPD